MTAKLSSDTFGSDKKGVYFSYLPFYRENGLNAKQHSAIIFVRVMASQEFVVLQGLVVLCI
ncbi:MAG: hypothetical protein LV471_10035 [Nitrosomonas sp.]|nr:hypothetical protein [Nitrosomonas sp.]